MTSDINQKLKQLKRQKLATIRSKTMKESDKALLLRFYSDQIDQCLILMQESI